MTIPGCQEAGRHGECFGSLGAGLSCCALCCSAHRLWLCPTWECPLGVTSTVIELGDGWVRGWDKFTSSASLEKQRRAASRVGLGERSGRRCAGQGLRLTAPPGPAGMG